MILPESPTSILAAVRTSISPRWVKRQPGHDRRDLLIGTSYATPHISALLAGAMPEPDSVDALLARHAHDAGAPGRDDVYGVGILMTPSHAVILAGLPRK